jgi:formamidopyrimidine-DNA glycosylase
MFELPEYVTLTRQINETLIGKTIGRGSLGNSPHKFVWYNRTPDDFATLTAGKQIGSAHTRGKWLFIPLEPGYLLVFGESGGKLLYHQPAAKLPEKYHLWITFTDGSALTAMTQMWGAMELYVQGEELERQYIKGMRVTPVEPEFTFAYFTGLIDELLTGPKRSVKALLTQEQLIPGLGNAVSQDILFHARLHPRHPLGDLAEAQRAALYASIMETVQTCIAQGGRNDEVDLYNRPGGYIRLLDSGAAGKPCPQCGTPIEKIQYLGGASYFCPCCQV